MNSLEPGSQRSRGKLIFFIFILQYSFCIISRIIDYIRCCISLSLVIYMDLILGHYILLYIELSNLIGAVLLLYLFNWLLSLQKLLELHLSLSKDNHCLAFVLTHGNLSSDSPSLSLTFQLCQSAVSDIVIDTGIYLIFFIRLERINLKLLFSAVIPPSITTS